MGPHSDTKIKIMVVSSQTDLEKIHEEDYFKKLLQALLNIQGKYETFVTLDTSDTYKTQRAERVFAYELYHQYRCLMHNTDQMILNGELYKDTSIFDKLNGFKCYPDLVLHSDYTETSPNLQYFICEIKMAHNPNLLSDFTKLQKIKQTGLKFKYNIFICLGLSMQELKQKLSKQQKYVVHEMDIVCICKKNGVVEYSYLN